MFDDNNQEILLDVSNIEVVYNNIILVLRGVSLTVEKGGITALLGGNGAGKSTTLKSVSNLLRSERGEVTKGTISYNGESIKDLEKVSIKTSIENLESYPFIRERLDRKEINIYGSWIDIGSGKIHVLDFASSIFQPI